MSLQQGIEWRGALMGRIAGLRRHCASLTSFQRSGAERLASPCSAAHFSFFCIEMSILHRVLADKNGCTFFRSGGDSSRPSSCWFENAALSANICDQPVNEPPYTKCWRLPQYAHAWCALIKGCWSALYEWQVAARFQSCLLERLNAQTGQFRCL